MAGNAPRQVDMPLEYINQWYLFADLIKPHMRAFVHACLLKSPWIIWQVVLVVKIFKVGYSPNRCTTSVFYLHNFDSSLCKNIQWYKIE